MRLEEIDYIFEKGGITGGVLSKGGRVTDRRIDIEQAHPHADVAFGDEKSASSTDSPSNSKAAFEFVEGK